MIFNCPKCGDSHYHIKDTFGEYAYWFCPICGYKETTSSKEKIPLFENPIQTPWVKWIVYPFVSIVVIIIIGAILGPCHKSSYQANMQNVGSVNASRIVIDASIANIRNGAGKNYPVIYTANKGKILNVANETQEWYQVKLDNGIYGWINKSVCKVAN